MNSGRLAFEIDSDGRPHHTLPFDQHSISHPRLIRQTHHHASLYPAAALQMPFPKVAEPLLLVTAGAAEHFTHAETGQGPAIFVLLGLLAGILFAVMIVVVCIYSFLPQGAVEDLMLRRTYSSLPSSNFNEPMEPSSTAVWNSDEEQFNADVDNKDDCFFLCKLNKLNEDAFDEPAESKNWRPRELWIGHRGALHYYSKLQSRVATFFDGETVDRLDVKRYCLASSPYPFCASVGKPPSDFPEEDPNPTIFGVEKEEHLTDFMAACRNYTIVQEHKKAATFATRLLMYDSSAGDNGRRTKANWKTREVWINVQGIMCYWSANTSSISAIGDGVGIAHLNIKTVPKGETCHSYCFSLASRPGRDPNLFAVSDRNTLDSIFEAQDRFKDDVDSSVRKNNSDGEKS